MYLYYITSLLTTVTSLGLGLFVFYKNPDNKLHRSLLRLNITVALWSFFLFLHYASKSRGFAVFTLYALHSAVIFIPACYLNFVIDLLSIEKKKAVRAAYIACGTFLFISYTPYFMTGVKPKLFFNFYATAGPLYALWIAAYLIIAGYGMYLLLRNYGPSSPIKKIQIRYVLVASLIGFIGGATIYPLFYDIPIPPWGENIIFLYPLIFSVAVLKHDALELNIAIKQTITYSISIILIMLAYLITVLLSERLLRNVIGYESIWVSVAAATSIALLFTPLKNRVESIIERLYVQKAYQKLQRELVESDKSKALVQLAAGLAHEIRNPLTAIKTFGEYLPERYNDKVFRDEFSRIVKAEADKINSLVSQLLEFAKPSALNIMLCNVHDALDYTLSLLSSEILKADINIAKDYGRACGMITADPVKLKHIFFNLIRNSIEAVGVNGKIVISTRHKGDNLCIEISDNGCGIREKDLNRIFEPFYSSKDSGTGLGLSVVQSIVNEHSGTISAKSTPGKATTFTVSLPLHAKNPCHSKGALRLRSE